MNDRACPACKSENEDDASYCDQCGQPLNPPAGAGEDEGGCPACGGAVESRGDGKGVCSSCGLELFETPDEAAKPEAADAPPVPAETVERLTAAIVEKTRAGLPVERAVAEGCREVLGGADAPVPEKAPCPLCGTENPADAEACSNCSLYFERPSSPQPCPRCDRPVSGGQCACGAVLTLPKLLESIEPAVRWVCSRCKAPYAVAQPKCPDCGGALLSADRIKAFAARARAT